MCKECFCDVIVIEFDNDITDKHLGSTIVFHLYDCIHMITMRRSIVKLSGLTFFIATSQNPQMLDRLGLSLAFSYVTQ